MTSTPTKIRGGSARQLDPPRPCALACDTRGAVATGGSRSDEQLVALIRRGQRHAFDTLASRYQARLLRFCWQILRSKEDAEDALQDVLAAAFAAILADNREIYVRPWLYRIARNRCINQLRRATTMSAGTMDEHQAENGRTLVETVLRRQAFRELVNDVQQLPNSQRIALLLREIDGFSYREIAVAMRTTVPSVKSLLVRARAGLIESGTRRSLLHTAPPEALERARPGPNADTVTYQTARACAGTAA